MTELLEVTQVEENDKKIITEAIRAAITWHHPQEWEGLKSNDVKIRTRTENNAICRFPSQTQRKISTSEQGCSDKGKTQKRDQNDQGFETKDVRQDRSMKSSPSSSESHQKTTEDQR